MRHVIKKFEGTTLGRQELHAEMLDEAPGALGSGSKSTTCGVGVGVDPTVSEDGSGDESGIVVGALEDYRKR